MRRFWTALWIASVATLLACGGDSKLEVGKRLDAGSEDSSGFEDAEGTDTGGPGDAGDTSSKAEALYVYDDALNSDWIDASWDAEVDFGATEQLHSGTHAIRVDQQLEGALSFLHGDWGAAEDINPTDYRELTFEIYSAEPLELDIALQGDTSFDRVNVGVVAADQWTTVSVSFDQLAPGGNPFHRINILEVGDSASTYFVDHIRLIGEPSATDPDAGAPGDAGTNDAGDDGGGELPYSEFVSVDPDAPRFLLEGTPFYFVGTNLYWMVQRRAYGHAMVDDAFDMCQDMGLRVIRIWGFADGDDWTDPSDSAIMQPDAGVFNESTFEALDYILAEAEKHDVKVIIPFVNYWEEYGGMLQYAQWAGGNSREYFYTELAAKQLYKDYIENMLTRVNTITGEEYRNDATIMAWELANEARAAFDAGASEGTLELWYAEMAAYVRSLDANHLIASGEEGWDISDYSDQYADDYTNEYAIRGAQGSSYIDTTSLADISYGGAHLYPDVWGFSNPVGDGQRWITDHAAIARQYGKPFVLGEFGYDDRSVYADWLQTAEDEDVAGTLMWQIVPASRGRENSMTIVYPDDTELVDLFKQHAQYMNTKGE